MDHYSCDVQVLLCLSVLGLTSGFPQLGNYNSPQAQSAASPAGSDYGAAAAPACRTEYKQECSTTTERECTTVNEQQVLGLRLRVLVNILTLPQLYPEIFSFLPTIKNHFSKFTPKLAIIAQNHIRL